MKKKQAFSGKRDGIRNIVAGLFCAAVLFLVNGTPPSGLSPAGFRMIGIALTATVLWSTEAVPLPVTGLTVIFLQIVLNIMPVGESLAYLANPVNALLFAGFCLAAGLKKYDLDRKISVAIIKRAGTDVRKLLFFMMCAVAFLSMWMSNTATAAVMIPIAAAILKMSEESHRNVGKIFTIGIAYASTIGGIATPVGTTPNPIAIGFLDELANVQVNFLDWVVIGLPFTVVLVPLAWLILVKLFPPEIKDIKTAGFTESPGGDSDDSRAGERKVFFYFALLMLLWVGGSFFPVPAGWLYIVSLGGSIAMFLPSLGMLTWEDTRENVDWGVLILIGGGIALGGGMVKTGALDWLVGFLSVHAQRMPVFLVMALVAAATSLGTLVFCSITATSTAFIPVAIALAGKLNANPVFFAAAAGVASSFAFILPANTPPNAIAYGSGYFETRDMIKAGIFLLIASILSFFVISCFLWPLLQL